MGQPRVPRRLPERRLTVPNEVAAGRTRPAGRGTTPTTGKRAMNICLITSSYKLGPGDASVPFLAENVRQLADRGARVHVFAPSYEGCPGGEVDGVPVHRFRYF